MLKHDYNAMRGRCHSCSAKVSNPPPEKPPESSILELSVERANKNLQQLSVERGFLESATSDLSIKLISLINDLEQETRESRESLNGLDEILANMTISQDYFNQMLNDDLTNY